METFRQSHQVRILGPDPGLDRLTFLRGLRIPSRPGAAVASASALALASSSARFRSIRAASSAAGSGRGLGFPGGSGATRAGNAPFAQLFMMPQARLSIDSRRSGLAAAFSSAIRT